jgi:hypothetical protein
VSVVDNARHNFMSLLIHDNEKCGICQVCSATKKEGGIPFFKSLRRADRNTQNRYFFSQYLRATDETELFPGIPMDNHQIFRS